MRRPVLLVLPVLLVALAAVGAAVLRDPFAETPPSTLAWSACDSALAEGSRCGSLRVAEDRSDPQSNFIEIAFSVLSATRGVASADPVLVLLGGPGDAASRRISALALEHAALNVDRDLILVDQRGTGRSAPLECRYGNDDDLQSYMDFLPTVAIRECIGALSQRADLTRYLTRDFVADLEELRDALRISQWNLHGNSHGTRVALQYMARHPNRIRSAVLHGVVPPELVVPVPFGADADRALEMIIADCLREAPCATAFPRLAAELDSIAHRLERAPVSVMVAHPVTTAPTSVVFTRSALGEAVRAMLYTPAGARALPLAIHESFNGDHSALATLHLRRQRGIGRDGLSGLYLAVTCAEDLARADSLETYRQSRATILGDHRARQHFAACAMWPNAALSDIWPHATRIRVPVLMLVGEADPATPPHWAQLALEGMVRGRLIRVPQGGHGFLGLRAGDCLARLQADFVATASVAALDTGCVGNIERLPFLTSR